MIGMEEDFNAFITIARYMMWTGVLNFDKAISFNFKKKESR